MSELARSVREEDSTSEMGLDKEAILNDLFNVASELGIDVEEIDVEDLLGMDDTDFLGNLATLAFMHGHDHEDFFGRLHIPVEHAVEFDTETE